MLETGDKSAQVAWSDRWDFSLDKLSFYRPPLQGRHCTGAEKSLQQTGELIRNRSHADRLQLLIDEH
jgi:hypothetical protein